MKKRPATRWMERLWKLRLPMLKLMPQLSRKRTSGLMLARAVFSGILSSLLMAASAAFAGGGGMTGGATEMTQILNNVQLADSYAQQVMAYQNQLLQYETMLKNLLAHPNGVTAPNLSQLASNQAKIMTMGTDISSSMAQVDTNFATTFKNPTAASYATKFNLWTNTSHDALRAAMLNAGLQREQFADDATAVQALTTNVASSQGNLAALQALGGLNAAQLQESMKLRDLISQQQVAQNTYLAAQAAKDQAKQDNNRAIMGTGGKPPPNRADYK